MQKLKIGFLGAGRMAEMMGDTIRQMDSAENYAVAAVAWLERFTGTENAQ